METFILWIILFYLCICRIHENTKQILKDEINNERITKLEIKVYEKTN